MKLNKNPPLCSAIFIYIYFYTIHKTMYFNLVISPSFIQVTSVNSAYIIYIYIYAVFISQMILQVIVAHF